MTHSLIRLQHPAWSFPLLTGIPDCHKSCGLAIVWHECMCGRDQMGISRTPFLSIYTVWKASRSWPDMLTTIQGKQHISDNRGLLHFHKGACQFEHKHMGAYGVDNFQTNLWHCQNDLMSEPPCKRSV